MAKQKSNLSRAFSEDGAIKTHVGGQALLEGVMMRGKYNWACAVRSPDGSIYTEEHDLASGKDKNKWMSLPLIRGCVALVESLGLGYKALEVAADHAFDKFDMTFHAYCKKGVDPTSATDEQKMKAAGWSEDEIEEYLTENTAETMPAGVEAEPDSSKDVDASQVQRQPAEEHKFSWKDDFGNPDEMIDALGAQRTLEPVTCPPEESEPRPAKKQESESGIPKGLMSASMLLGLVFGVVLFIVAPAALTNLLVGEYDSNMILWNVIDGVIRVAIFVFYLWLIGRMKDIKRMFSYHGAEHKTIHCYEHSLELTPENARSFPRLHVRCGTAFLIMVMILAILVYTIVPVNALILAWGVPDGLPKLVLVILVRIVFMPVIAGLAYEINVRWAGQHPDNPLVKVVLWPGLQLQYLTTNEPDDSMLECAIASMKMVLEREEAEKNPA